MIYRLIMFPLTILWGFTSIEGWWVLSALCVLTAIIERDTLFLYVAAFVMLCLGIWVDPLWYWAAGASFAAGVLWLPVVALWLIAAGHI